MKPSPLRILQLCTVAFTLSWLTPSAQADPPLDRSNSQRRQFLIRAQDLVQAEAQYGLRALRQSMSDGEPLVLVEGPAGMTPQQVLAWTEGDANLQQIEPAILASLTPQSLASDPISAAAQAAPDLDRTGTYATPCMSSHLSTDLWAGYADQRAVNRINNAAAQVATGSGCGQGITVAIIDTGVDEAHPLLQDALVPGFDFLEGTTTASEWSSLDHSARAIVEHSARAIVEQSEAAVVAGNGAAIALDSIAPVLCHETTADLGSLGLEPYFGHGTMVAGLVRLVAPGAQLMPLRVFDAQGSGHLYDIINAIYFAVDQGAQVINMSFSLTEYSNELKRAVEYARHRGVVMVAAAGNQGQDLRVYPAALNAPLGVAALDLDDTLVPFSNYGADTATLAAPGTAVVSLFPGGGFAAGWGTSFSAPLVAGTLALIHPTDGNGNVSDHNSTRSDVLKGTEALLALESLVSRGSLDSFGAVLESQN